MGRIGKKIKMKRLKAANIQQYRTRLAKALQLYNEANRHLKRRHANFFLTPRKYRSIGEINIASHLLAHLESSNIVTACISLQEGMDPPDVLARFIDERLWGIEITELVEQKAITAQINGNRSEHLDLNLSWTSGKIVDSIQTLITRKSAISPNVRKAYDCYVLLIHTDERALTPEKVMGAIKGVNWVRGNTIDNAYLLFSYNPQHKCCPVVTLF